MINKTAKLFTNGGSQAVRLPAEFRFTAADEVYVRRGAVTGDVILSSKPVDADWAGFFALRDSTELRNELLSTRPLNEPLRSRVLSEDDGPCCTCSKPTASAT